ncbi:50S ribosomal protein L3 [Candidatus Gottesmanbacteria bacterium RBG_16_52_11]|uniref:Large ribosomal subunit protein uL3 n=1 Tax=Candidatus Gottesmanbacteria bacterium RBG_16_52_11 TaxID=1798374 RepID=A0A1F5YXT4_9BACT|nr:MAG: 50S ribosomal protein L3 [Candidatus Gottesmanbacteria bacterium RBG_16_52_11]
MLRALIGTKLGQTQTFTPEGKRIPVTMIQAGPCFITAIDDRPGQHSVQLGFGTVRNISKPRIGHLKKTGLTQKLRFLREFPVEEISADMKPGDQVQVDAVFHPGDRVRVTGTSIGKGFAGVVKRHGFKGGPRTHGQSDRERAPGSIGQTTTPGRVYKGKRMAGRMGGERVTVRGLRIVGINPQSGLITVSGVVPGPKQGFVVITKEA